MTAGRPSTEEVLAAVGVARELHAELEVSDPLTDLANRLRKADKALRNLAAESVGSETMRLAGKAEGVRLALSYIEETQR